MTGTRSLCKAPVRLCAVAAACLGLAACADDYLARRDTLSPGSGDAVRADIAKQVIDPWSPASRQNNLDFSGQRLQHAMELYRNPSSGVPTVAFPTPTGGVATPVVR